MPLNSFFSAFSGGKYKVPPEEQQFYTIVQSISLIKGVLYVK